MDFEVDLDRQVLQPGEEVIGWVTLGGPEVKKVELVFQGEEILGANDVGHTLIQPVVDEKLTISAGGDLGRVEFRFPVPENLPPTYASRDIRCVYSVKASVPRGFMRRTWIRKLHLTILPRAEEGLQALPVDLEVEHDDLRLIAHLNSTVVLTGESVEGTLLLERKKADAKLPKKLSFRLAAIEKSLEKFFPHREVLTLETNDITVDPELDLPLVGDFEFPIHEASEPSGRWNTFEVDYGFRVVMIDHTGKDFRKSIPITIYRDLKLRRDYQYEMLEEEKEHL